MSRRPAGASVITRGTPSCDNAAIGAFGGPVGILAGGVIGGVIGGLAGSQAGKLIGGWVNNGISAALHS